MKKRALFTILTIALVIQVNATDYYFSASQRDDSRSSTQAQNPSTPWKSLSKLNSWFSNLEPGDHILFKSGDTFYGSITTLKSGTSSSPIVISSYGKGTIPTISGLTTVTGWTSIGNGIYQSSVLPAGTSVNMVTINDQGYAMGRYPDVTASNAGYLSFESHGSNSITDNENVLTNTWSNAQLVVRSTHGSIETSTITNVSGKTISYSPSFQYSLTDGYGYFVQNHIKTLDQFGEWYYNPSTHRLNVYFGSAKPSSYAVQASAVDVLFTAHHSNIELNGIGFKGANKYAIYNDLSGVTNLHINNCRILFSGVDAIALAGTSNFLMENSNILNSNSLGIDLFYKNLNALIKNTTIQNTATLPGMMIKDVGNRYGIAIYASEGLTALNNTIVNTGYIGIYFTGNNNLIQNNFINNFCTVLDDGGAIYTWGGKSNPANYNRKVIANIVLNGIGAKAGTYSSDPNYIPAEGIYVDANAINVEILNNTIANCANNGIYIHNGRGITIRNNVIYNNYVQIGFQHDNTGVVVSGEVIKRNQLFCRSVYQLVLRLASSDNDFSSFGSFDSNYYCRPFKEDGIIFINWFRNKEGYYNLSQWQSTYGKDLHSKKTPVSVASAGDILFQYNASTSIKSVTLDGTYIGLNSVKYSGTINLAPYTSIILLKISSLNRAGAFGNLAETNASVEKNGNLEPGHLKIRAYPNPSSTYFNVSTQSNSSEPMTLRVIDLSGKVEQIETGVYLNRTLQVGQDLAPGTYILELIQGNKKVERKAIKSSEFK